MSELENQDVFSDEAEVTAETESKEEVKDEPKSEESQTTEEQGTEAATQQGEQDAEPPAADGDNKVQKSEKMIPEHRLKAALKDVNEKLSKAEQRLAELTATPPPDRASDPEGYDRHVRIETSKMIMAETYDDYDEKIAHFQEMAKVQPELNTIVGNHHAPAKMAYDLAKKDLEIKELTGLKDSDEWKQFQEWKKSGGKVPAQEPEKALDLKKTAKETPKVPNLNRNLPSAARPKTSSEDDELFAGHYNKWA